MKALQSGAPRCVIVFVRDSDLDASEQRRLQAAGKLSSMQSTAIRAGEMETRCPYADIAMDAATSMVTSAQPVMSHRGAKGEVSSKVTRVGFNFF